MNECIVKAISKSTGEVVSLFGKLRCSSKRADGTIEYMKLYHHYIDTDADHKLEIEVYPEHNLVSVTEYIMEEDDTHFVALTGIPELYTLDRVFQQII